MKRNTIKKTDQPIELYIRLKYDGVLPIAVGRSRMETNWRNTEIKWKRMLSIWRWERLTRTG